MFTDKRSKRVVLVIHCILNHNARIDECAYYPGAMTEIVQTLMEAGVGIVQMPCPELHCLGLDRSGRIKDGQQTGIREALFGDAAEHCRALVRGVMRDVLEYRKHGFEVVGVIGNDGSPACGVDYTWYETGFGPGRGAFMTMLQEELQAAGLTLPLVATQDHKWEERLERIRALVKGRL
jgi:predicted secreted protein